MRGNPWRFSANSELSSHFFSQSERIAKRKLDFWRIRQTPQLGACPGAIQRMAEHPRDRNSPGYAHPQAPIGDPPPERGGNGISHTALTQNRQPLSWPDDRFQSHNRSSSRTRKTSSSGKQRASKPGPASISRRFQRRQDTFPAGRKRRRHWRSPIVGSGCDSLESRHWRERLGAGVKRPPVNGKQPREVSG